MFLVAYHTGLRASVEPIVDPVNVTGLTDKQITNREVRLASDLMFMYGLGDTMEDLEENVSIMLVEDPYAR